MVEMRSSIRVAPPRQPQVVVYPCEYQPESLSSRSSTTTAPMERCVKRSDVIFLREQSHGKSALHPLAKTALLTQFTGPSIWTNID
jgi:hypothetical protein